MEAMALLSRFQLTEGLGCHSIFVFDAEHGAKFSFLKNKGLGVTFNLC
jgi:hypothetical protein